MEKIDKPEEIRSYLSILGEKHMMYGADAELIESMAFIMFDCIHSVLEQEVNFHCDSFQYQQYK